MIKPLLRSKVLWALVLATSVGAWATSHIYETHEFNEAKAMSEEMFKPDAPQTVCVGRVVFDLPKGAKQQGSLYQYQGANKKIEETPHVTQADFEKSVHDFEEQLRTTKHEKDPSLLKSVRVLPGKDGAKVFTHWENDFAEFAMNLTGYAWREGVQYRFTSQADFDRVRKVSDEMAYALEHLRPKAPNEVPREHGFCLDTAFIPDALKGEGLERTVNSFDVLPWEFVSISLTTGVNNVKPTDTLLERPAMAAKRAPGFDKTASVFHAGKRRVGDFHGEEMLVRMTESDRTYFLFIWEVQGAVKSNNPPDIHLELRVGQNGKPGEMTKVQALALWEYILPRLRLRPVTQQPTKVSTVEPLKPLGELAASGSLCSQTGWWACSEPRPVQGGEKQFFRKGEAMPKVALLLEQSMWQKMKGETPTHRTTTVWKLVEYDPADVPATYDEALVASAPLIANVPDPAPDDPPTEEPPTAPGDSA